MVDMMNAAMAIGSIPTETDLLDKVFKTAKDIILGDTHNYHLSLGNEVGGDDQESNSNDPVVSPECVPGHQHDQDPDCVVLDDHSGFAAHIYILDDKTR